MCPNVRWIAGSSALGEALAEFGRGPLAVDTEADSFHHYREKICLLQLSFGGLDFLVDPLLELDPAPLRALLGDRSIQKILHGSDYDLRLLDRDLALRVCGLFDTMVAARLVGERSFSLVALLARHLGVQLDKRFQRADWSVRPLPPELVEYAALDTRHLAALAELLQGRLLELGRAAWAAEEFLYLEQVGWTPSRRSTEGHLAVRGARRLDRRGLALLRELFGLRDELARAEDLPPFRVLREEALLQLAETASAEGSAAAVRAAPATWRSGRRRTELLLALERGLAVAPDELPGFPERSRKRLAPALERRLSGLREDRNRLALALDLEPSLLASRALLERALEEIDRGGAPESLPEMRRWQAALLRGLLARWSA